MQIFKQKHTLSYVNLQKVSAQMYYYTILNSEIELKFWEFLPIFTLFQLLLLT